MKFSIDEVVAATGGRLVGRSPRRPGSISTDTRTLTAGQTFLAIRGERFDGHDFLDAAVRRGAACLIVDREDRLPDLVTAGQPHGAAPTVAVVVVKDTLAALADLGRAARKRLTCPVIAVTGSCGKTTV